MKQIGQNQEIKRKRRKKEIIRTQDQGLDLEVESIIKRKAKSIRSTKKKRKNGEKWYQENIEEIDKDHYLMINKSSKNKKKLLLIVQKQKMN